MAKKMNFATMSIEELQNVHSEMLATAGDLGFQAPDETLVEFDTAEEGAKICTVLHAALEKHRAGIDAKDEKKPVASAPKSAQNGSLPDTAKGRKIKAQTAVKPEGEKTVAAAAKKKAAPKKVATPKKGVAKKAAAKESAARAPKFDENKKIAWTFKGEGNGCREGTEKHSRHELVRKHSGKTVGAFLKAGGLSATLSNCVAQGKAKVA